MRLPSLGLLLLLTLISINGQEVYYYGVNSKPVDNQEDALTIKEVRKKSNDRYVVLSRQFKQDGWAKAGRQKIKIRQEHNLVIHETGPDRLFPRKITREMHRNGQGMYFFKDSDGEMLLREGSSSTFIPLHLEGRITEYYPGGQVKSISQYEDNQLKSNENWLADGTRYVDNLFYSVDRLPEFEYGVQFFNSYLMQKLSTTGFDLSQIDDRVVMGWVILETGALDSPVALEGNSSQLKQILTSIISEMPGLWKPASLNGKPVRYFITLPLNFFHRDVSFQNLETSSGVLLYDKF